MKCQRKIVKYSDEKCTLMKEPRISLRRNIVDLSKKSRPSYDKICDRTYLNCFRDMQSRNRNKVKPWQKKYRKANLTAADFQNTFMNDFSTSNYI